MTDAIANAGPATADIKNATADIQNDLNNLTKYIQDNQANLNASYISAQLSFIKAKIAAFTVSVDSFTNNLKPTTPACTITCKTNFTVHATGCYCYCASLDCPTEEYVPNYEGCYGAYFPDYAILKNLSRQAYYFRNYVAADMRNVTLAEEYLTYTMEFQRLQSAIYAEENKFMNVFDSSNKTLLSMEIYELVANYTRLSTLYNTIAKGSSSCDGSCPHNTIEVANCSCYSSAYYKRYFNDVIQFVYYTENEIRDYAGPGSKTELAIFKSRSREMRLQFSRVYKYFYDNYPNYDDAAMTSLLDDLHATATKLKDDWAAWKKLQYQPPPTCKVVVGYCNGSTIANIKTCSCDFIDGWDQLPNITSALPSLQAQINGLNTDPTNLAKVQGNWNIINSTIPELQAYVVSDASNLDEGYVQAQTTQIINWYKTLIAQIASLQSGGSLPSCSISCPNSNWVLDSAACSCNCNVPSCLSTQAIDYYNCMCAEVNACAKTQSQCEANSEILDYASCLCKPHP